MNTQDFTIQEEQLPLILSLLDESQLFPIQPQGCSMFPFFMGNRDTLYIKKPVFPLKRGDIALYRRKNGTYVVHRVHHTKEAAPSGHSLQYYMLGDHQTWIEGPIEEDQIYGYVTAYERKGKKNRLRFQSEVQSTLAYLDAPAHCQTTPMYHMAFLP